MSTNRPLDATASPASKLTTSPYIHSVDTPASPNPTKAVTSAQIRPPPTIPAWPFLDSNRRATKTNGRKVGYEQSRSNLVLEGPRKIGPRYISTPEVTPKPTQRQPVEEETERSVVVYNPTIRQPRFRHASPENFNLSLPYANDHDQLKPPIPRPLVKVVLMGPSPSYEPRRLARMTSQHPDGLYSVAMIAEPPTLPNPFSHRHPQYADGIDYHDAPYAQHPGAVVAYSPPRFATRVTRPELFDHVYQGIADPKPQGKITPTMRRYKATPDHVMTIFAHLPTKSDYSQAPRLSFISQTPYGTELCWDPSVGPTVRSQPFCISPKRPAPVIPAAPPGRLQRNKGLHAPPTRSNIIGFDLD